MNLPGYPVQARSDTISQRHRQHVTPACPRPLNPLSTHPVLHKSCLDGPSSLHHNCRGHTCTLVATRRPCHHRGRLPCLCKRCWHSAQVFPLVMRSCITITPSSNTSHMLTFLNPACQFQCKLQCQHSTPASLQTLSPLSELHCLGEAQHWSCSTLSRPSVPPILHCTTPRLCTHLKQHISYDGSSAGGIACAKT